MQLLWKAGDQCHKKQVPYDSAVTLLGKYPRTGNMATVAFIIAKKCGRPKEPSADEWMNKIRSVRAMGCYPARKKNKMLTHTTWMSLNIYQMKEAR